MDDQLINILRTLVLSATPLTIAAIGETITERAGVINLSLDGSLALAAMAGFAAALATGSPEAGILAAMIVGALVAAIIAIASIELRLDQVAIGFVLTLLAADLAEFLGVPIAGQRVNGVPYWPLPILSDIPIIGRIFFDHNALVYFSYLLVIGTWFWLFRTRAGLAHRAIGERPEAAYARGTRVNFQRYIYVIVGGALIGLAGASYSLSVRVGWTTPPSMLGDGWIALAIVIFGGWHPARVMAGAYLFAGLRAVAGAIQSTDIAIPVTILNGLPWLLMIATLLVVSSGGIERLLRILPTSMQHRLRSLLRSDPPRALGTRFDEA
ncbi:ABC transporter permease [Phototrophicus methaneseepsis]|uniref:ABC transporter permease n=1 Tax=Phototrophicus methaneseepsis TaxID=2710758 RepID=A0A7S8IFN9_9CHLR|nr:ABC transporter permease [Phototrophicus methaneseepsis]QPC83802.1 ABC transporter permease [Phototrophicus methaneseepsis]